MKIFLADLDNKNNFEFLKNINLIPNENRKLVINNIENFNKIEFVGLFDTEILVDNTLEIEEKIIKTSSILKKRKNRKLDKKYRLLHKEITNNIQNSSLEIIENNKKVNFDLRLNSNQVNKKNLNYPVNVFKERNINAYGKNNEIDLINFVFLDIILQNKLCDIISDDIVIYLKDKKQLVKIKKTHNKSLPNIEKEYNSPIMPVSF